MLTGRPQSRGSFGIPAVSHMDASYSRSSNAEQMAMHVPDAAGRSEAPDPFAQLDELEQRMRNMMKVLEAKLQTQ